MKGKCTHCNTPIGCGCNKATASDGSLLHKKCLNEYNNSLVETVETVETIISPFNPGRVVIPPTTAR